MPSEQEQQRFLATFCEWLVSLPHDLKVLFEAKDDPNLDRATRELATGAIVHVISPEAAGEEAFVSYADDVVMLRLVLQAIVDRNGEDSEPLTSRFTDLYDSLQKDMTLCREIMGPAVFEWIDHKIDSLPKLVYKSKKVVRYLDDEEQGEILYQDGLEFGTNYPLDEDVMANRVKRWDTILEPLHRKVSAAKQRL